jgi:hypothetical protein
MRRTLFTCPDETGAELNVTDTRGYSCAVGVEDNNCYGHTGIQVLDSLGTSYQNVTTSNTVVRRCRLKPVTPRVKTAWFKRLRLD